MDTLAKLGGQEEMMTDETKLDGLAAIGNDRDRAQILDLEKWDMSHQIYKQALSSLAGVVLSSSSSSSSSGSNSSSRSDINGMEDRGASQADSQTSLTATAAAQAPAG